MDSLTAMPKALEDFRDQIDTPEIIIAIVTVFSAIAYRACVKSIPRVMQVLFERGIYGIDINKTTAEQRQEFKKMKQSGNFSPEFKKLVVPESLGIVVGGIYLCVVALAMTVTSHVNKCQVNAALSTIAVMLLLGFVDDVLDVRWRYKLILSFFGTMPLLLSYEGFTSVVVPLQLREALGVRVIHFGNLYTLLLAFICVFCTNSINILAGVNGVEVGQSLVIGVAALIHSLIQLRDANGDINQPYMLSLVLLLPFIAVSLALFKFNRYPSRVFVGDSYTYFAGIVLAVAGIAGGYSKTMLLFFAPQLFNFIISIPQLFHIVECPRHRVPKWDAKRNVLVNSRNYTILNTILLFTGDLHERTLTNVTLGVQIACCALGFVIRYVMAGLFFEIVE